MASWVIQSLAVCAMCVFLAGILIPQILLVAFRKSLFDEIDERKIHHGAVPRLGGIAFTPVICFSLSLVLGLSLLPQVGSDWSLTINTRQVAFGFCALLLLYIVGMADDLIGIRYRAKFAVQLICSLLLIGGGLCCTDFYGVFGLDDVPHGIGAMATILMVVFIINAINLIDGIDGLASGLSMAAFLIYGIAFGISGNTEYSMLAFAGLGVLIPFFGFNVFGNPAKRSKIFMGDTGALTIGLVLCFLGLALLEQLDDTHATVFGANPMVVVLAPLLIPCLDVVRVFMRRIRHHGNPFIADRTHIHHKLLDLGIKPRPAMLTIVLSSIGFSAFNIWLSRWLDINLLLTVDAVIWTLTVSILNKLSYAPKTT